MRHLVTSIFFITLICFTFSSTAFSNEPSREEILQQRMSYYVQFEQTLFVPWHYLAAVDQFERNIQQVRKDIPIRESVIAIQISDEYWAGLLNPYQQDTSLLSIQYFGGFGLDGNGDGLANPKDDIDTLFTIASFLSTYGQTEDDFKLALWDYYKKEETVNQILNISKMYKHFNTLNLDRHAFPVAITYNYSYRGTWGANRGWGGRRIHEGTDIFAGYGTPVKSASYGIVEIMGWNEFGGWRVGIRDHHNTYHYYAHLAYFNEGLEVGDVVEPGDVIGFVGNSGYGKEGTSGKFPPHLHYGMYKYNGRTEWAFDPYPSLKLWERQAKKSKK